MGAEQAWNRCSSLAQRPIVFLLFTQLLQRRTVHFSTRIHEVLPPLFQCAYTLLLIFLHLSGFGVDEDSSLYIQFLEQAAMLEQHPYVFLLLS
jgi:hypothetical protein